MPLTLDEKCFFVFEIMMPLYKLMPVILLSLFLAACGGGGSSGDSDATTPIVYTGLTDQATVTSSNAVDLLRGAMGNSPSSGIGNSLVGSTVSVGSALPIMLRQISLLTQQPMSMVTQSRLIASSVEISVGVACSVGGTFDEVYEETFPLFTASYNYYGCDEGDGVISGHVDVTGLLDEDRNTSSSVSTFTALSYSSDAGSFTMNGTFSSNFALNPTEIIVFNISILNNIDKRVEKLEAMTVHYTSQEVDDDAMAINGRYYHPDYGYVDVLTLETFYIADADTMPYLGHFQVSGGGDTSAAAFALDKLQFRMRVDTDGDGFTDVEAVKNWLP